MTPTVAILGTGGTIASTAGANGAEPTLSSDSLVDAVPDLEDYASLTVEEVAQTPSFDMDFGTLADLAGAVEDAAADGADGVVVTHGTDTMEESAYYLDLVLGGDVPVVFTGAQRRPDEISADGPANLRTAVRAASHDRLREAGGVYVAFDEELHAARDVTKVHTRKLNAFASPGTGPVATVARDDVRFVRAPGSRSRSLPVRRPDGTVRVVTSGVGADGGAIEAALDDGVDGIVLAGTGVGNATGAIGDAVGTAIEAGVPVIVTSRCVAGPVAPVYGTAGGGQTLSDRGAIFADDLPAQKARIELLLTLEAGEDSDGLGEYFVREAP